MVKARAERWSSYGFGRNEKVLIWKDSEAMVKLLAGMVKGHDKSGAWLLAFSSERQVLRANL